MSDQLPAELARVVGDAHVLTEPDVVASFETDWTGRYRGDGRCVVRPGSVDEVAETMRVCAAHRVAVVPQGGNTGLVGGSIPRNGEVVLSLTRLEECGEVDTAASQVSVGAGVTIADLHAHAGAAGLGYGVDLASRDSATVGGTIATNAGGVNVVRHGGTRAQVIGIEAVLADGTILRRMHGLAKDSTGYDLPGLLTGSEGTLGVITAARLRLVPAMAEHVVALMGVPDFGVALEILTAVRHLASLQAVEWFDREGMQIVCEHASLADPLPRPYPVYVLVECAAAADPTHELATALDRCEGIGDVAVATDRPDRRRLWSYRERAAEALNAAGIPLKFDVGVPPQQLPEFDAEARRICADLGGRLFVFGHLAEGNAHANVLSADPDDVRIDDAILRLAARLGGTISAEHGVGTAKLPWLELTRSAADRAAMAAVKQALDPHGMLNPGVLLPAESPAAEEVRR